MRPVSTGKWRTINRHILRSSAQIDKGFSLPLTIIAAFMLLLGGLALANRANFSILGSLFTRQGWEAREAAESGAERIIGELNRPENRRFMLSSSSTAQSNTFWTSTDFDTSSTSASVLKSQCSAAGQTLLNNRQLGTNSSTPSGPYPWVYLNSSGLVITSPSGIPSGATRAFRLYQLVRRPSLREFDLQSNAGWGRFSIQIDGASISNGQIVSQIRLEREYQVMPKCCNTSFGSPFGAITYNFDTSDCLKNALGFGLIGGAAENNTGTVTISGSISAVSGTTTIDNIYCVINQSVGGGCSVSDSANSLNVTKVPADLPSVPYPPATLTSSTTDDQGNLTSIWLRSGKSALTVNTSTLEDVNTSSFIYCTASTGRVRTSGYRCNSAVINPANLNAVTMVDGGGTNYSNNCTILGTNTTSSNNQSTGSIEEVHCLVNSIQFQGANIRIVAPADSSDSSKRRLRLYFIGTGVVVGQNGNEQISVCTTASGPTCTSPANLTDVSWFGCPSASQRPILLQSDQATPVSCIPVNTSIVSNQEVQLNGTPALGSGGGMFIWFPNGYLNLGGNVATTAVAWVNRIQANGNVSFVVPGAGLANVLTYTGLTLPTKPLGGGTFPIIDFVARATNNFRWIGI